MKESEKRADVFCGWSPGQAREGTYAKIVAFCILNRSICIRKKLHCMRQFNFLLAICNQLAKKAPIIKVARPYQAKPRAPLHTGYNNLRLRFYNRPQHAILKMNFDENMKFIEIKFQMLGLFNKEKVHSNGGLIKSYQV